MPTRMLTIRDRTMSMKEWSREKGAANYYTIADRLRSPRNWSVEDAVFKPARVGNWSNGGYGGTK